MSEQTEVKAPAPPAPAAPDVDLERRARSMGWRPKEEFRGDEAKWVPAEEYVRRGEEYIPLIRAENRKLEERLSASDRSNKELKAALDETRDTIAALREHQDAEVKRRVDRARAELRQQIKQARADDDVDAELEAQDALRELDREQAAVQKPTPAPKAPAPAPGEPKIDPAFLEWKEDNPWFETDPRRRGLAMGIAEDLRADPANNGLQGRKFYDKVSEELAKTLGERRESKVDGGRPGGSPAPAPASREKSYGDLPADAKSACDSMAARLVGSNRAYKTLDDWRKQYAKTFFEGEQ